MIQADTLYFAYPGNVLYNDISFTIADGSHCVLIGSNGTGKTTLIDLMLHPEKYLFDGKLIKEGVDRVGYVSQFIRHEKDRDITVFDYLREDFVKMEEEQDALCAEMETSEDYEAVMERYQAALDEYDAIDGYNHAVNIYQQLKLAGLKHLENVSVAQVSGGEYKLLQVIRQMLRLPGLLVMDEPDVFLDFENLRGLRDLINHYKGTLLVVTHNRYLLNHCFDKVLHLENQELREYEGPYIDYQLQQTRMKVEMQEANAKAEEWIQFQIEIADRLRERAEMVDSSANGRSLRARVSYIEHLKMWKTPKPFLEPREPKIALPVLEEENQPETVLSVNDYSVAFDEPLLENVSFDIKKGEKVALVGANGTGKTTLLRDIWKNQSDSITIHEGVEPAFLSQLYGEMLNEDNTIMDEFYDAGFGIPAEIEEYLASYCFPEDTMKKKISTLSGGEKNLLQLAKIGKGHANLLLLDEPTSHLDLYAQAALEKAVQAYKGAVLMVSHDFYSVANCVDRVLLVEKGGIRPMSARAFRKMIYKNHFNKDYLELEQRKKELELKIESLLKQNDYKTAKELCDKLEPVVLGMQG